MRLIDEAFGPADTVPVRGRTLLLEGVWQPGGQAVTAEVGWDADCGCGLWTPPTPPPATSRLEIDTGRLAVGAWRNRDLLVIEGL